MYNVYGTPQAKGDDSMAMNKGGMAKKKKLGYKKGGMSKKGYAKGGMACGASNAPTQKRTPK